MLKYTIRSRKGTKNLEISTKLPNGDIKRISAKTSNRKQAEIKAKQIVADYENQINNAIQNVNSAGRIIETKISDAVFLKDCVAYYLNEYCPNNSVKGIQNNRTNLEHIQKFFGIKTNVKTLTPNHIVEYIKHRRNKGKQNGTISRELIIFLSTLNRQVDTGNFTEDFVESLKISKLAPKGNVRKDYPTPAEIKLIRENLPDWFMI